MFSINLYENEYFDLFVSVHGNVVCCRGVGLKVYKSVVLLVLCVNT